MSVYDFHLEDQWKRYRAGSWVRAFPGGSGFFAIAGRDRQFRGFVYVRDDGGGRMRFVLPLLDRNPPYREAQHPAEIHRGWWWSRPVPVPPMVATEWEEGV